MWSSCPWVRTIASIVVEPITDVAEVREDQVDAGLVGLGEQHAAVDDQQPAAVLEDGHVAADLAEAAEGDDPQTLFGQRRRRTELGMRVAHSCQARVGAVASGAGRSAPASRRPAGSAPARPAGRAGSARPWSGSRPGCGRSRRTPAAAGRAARWRAGRRRQVGGDHRRDLAPTTWPTTLTTPAAAHRQHRQREDVVAAVVAPGRCGPAPMRRPRGRPWRPCWRRSAGARRAGPGSRSRSPPPVRPGMS